MALPLVCRARVSSLDIVSLPLFVLSFALSPSTSLFSAVSRVGATVDRAFHYDRGTAEERACVLRASLKKSIKRRIITEEGVSTHGIYDVLVHGRCCRFTAAVAAATRSSTCCPSPESDSVRIGLASRMNSRRCTSAPHSSPPRSDGLNILL